MGNVTANAVPEIARDAGFGGKCELRAIESHNDSMSPLEIWCNVSQLRDVTLDCSSSEFQHC